MRHNHDLNTGFGGILQRKTETSLVSVLGNRLADIQSCNTRLIQFNVCVIWKYPSLRHATQTSMLLDERITEC